MYSIYNKIKINLKFSNHILLGNKAAGLAEEQNMLWNKYCFWGLAESILSMYELWNCTLYPEACLTVTENRLYFHLPQY